MRSKMRSKVRSKRTGKVASLKVNALDESGLEEMPGRHDQPAEGGRAIVDQAIAAASSAATPAGSVRGRSRKSASSSRSGGRSGRGRAVSRTGASRRKAA